MSPILLLVPESGQAITSENVWGSCSSNEGRIYFKNCVKINRAK